MLLHKLPEGVLWRLALQTAIPGAVWSESKAGLVYAQDTGDMYVGGDGCWYYIPRFYFIPGDRHFVGSLVQRTDIYLPQRTLSDAP